MPFSFFMYPFIRFAKTYLTTKKDPNFDPKAESSIDLRVGLFDRDFYPELNNGRYYAMCDLGRIKHARLMGLMKVLREKKWFLLAAGSSGAWRHRLPLWTRYQLRTKVIDVDDRWFYFLHSFYVGDKMHANFLLRAGIGSKVGIVSPQEVMSALGFSDISFEENQWVKEWLKSEEGRPAFRK